MKKGDAIMVSGMGRTLPGFVELASANGLSLLVTFDGGIGGHMGCAALLWEDGAYRSVVDGTVMTVTGRPAP